MLPHKKIHPHELAFDVDGVFANTFQSFVDKARYQYGLQIYYDDITEYDYRNVIKIDDDINEKLIQMVVNTPIETGVQPIEGAVDVLTRLSEITTLFFVTARSEKNNILQWIKKQLKTVNISDICLSATGTHLKKIPVLQKHGVKFFIEDRLETCYLLSEVSITPIVFEQPWNQTPHPFHTVKSWNEIAAMIEWETPRMAVKAHFYQC